jgi:hypothetical protein
MVTVNVDNQPLRTTSQECGAIFKDSVSSLACTESVNKSTSGSSDPEQDENRMSGNKSENRYLVIEK